MVVSDICLFSGFEDWYLKLECAASIRDNRHPPASKLDARDIVDFVPRPTKAAPANKELRKGWATTDQSIKNLADGADASSIMVEETNPGTIKTPSNHISEPKTHRQLQPNAPSYN
ncbi:hypothetical protein K4K59_004193 [Colletotrichum sp. SAR11_240]|nr:hypothetical protein K4K59_004193 [Colletotrichum sp. SAR11_240]